MLKPGDRCVIVGLKLNCKFNNETCTVIGDSQFHLGDLIVEMHNGYDARNDGFELKNPSISPDCLRKIDDNDDEIPANIRAIFDDKCDETLPEPSVHAEGGKE